MQYIYVFKNIFNKLIYDVDDDVWYNRDIYHYGDDHYGNHDITTTAADEHEARRDLNADETTY